MSTEVVKRSYGNKEIERALIAIAYANGNTRMAEKDLAEDKLEIPRSTLESWKQHVHVLRYEEVRAEILPKIREATGDEHLALARKQINASELATDAFVAALAADKVETRDLSTAARNFDVGSGIHSQNSQLMHGEPTQIVHRTSDELLRELEAEGVRLESIDAEVIEEETIEEES